MQITESAKEIFLNAMQRLKMDAIHIELVTHHCGGKGLNLQLIKKEDASRLIEVNGLFVDISEEDEPYMDTIVFDGEGNSIKLLSTAPRKEGCGCGGDGDCSSCDDCEGCN